MIWIILGLALNAIAFYITCCEHRPAQGYEDDWSKLTIPMIFLFVPYLLYVLWGVRKIMSEGPRYFRLFGLNQKERDELIGQQKPPILDQGLAAKDWESFKGNKPSQKVEGEPQSQEPDEQNWCEAFCAQVVIGARLEKEITSLKEQLEQAKDVAFRWQSASMDLKEQLTQAQAEAAKYKAALEKMIKEDNGGELSWQEIAREALKAEGKL